MAFFDDKYLLLEHIRNSFITSDDTGMCEMVLIDRDFPLPPRDNTLTGVSYFHGCESDNDDVDNSANYSPDITGDMDFRSIRRRTYTEIRLDKMTQDKLNKTQISRVFVDKNEPFIEKDETDAKLLFQKKEVSGDVGTIPKTVSLLSHQLDTCPRLPSNPFIQFSKYDGSLNVGVGLKKLRVFLTMSDDEDDRLFPTEISSIATAKVSDVIGLICWKYTHENKQPPLMKSPAHYGLNIAEDNGEVDWDFPSLDNKESVAKFGFDYYAFVEKEEKVNKPETVEQNYVVQVYLPSKQLCTLTFRSGNVTIQDIINNAVKHVKNSSSNPRDYTLTSDGDENSLDYLDNTLTLEEIPYNDVKFTLILKTDPELGAVGGDNRHAAHAMTTMEASVYTQYRVLKLGKLGRKTHVNLGISSEKIEICPIGSKGLLKEKPSIHHIDSIAGCEVRKAASYRMIISIVKCEANKTWKNYDFSMERHIALEIKQKLESILSLKGNNLQKEYAEYLNSKSHKNSTTLQMLRRYPP